jgi:citrate lyase subunit beta/citryl-CoA lyase
VNSTGIAELNELGALLTSLPGEILIQPIIEHPKSLKIADQIFAHKKVEHVVFGIHDFSRALQLMITAENWQDELYPFMCSLMVEARLAGKGIIGGVETLLLSADPPDVALLPEWLGRHAEPNARIICNHARREASLGFTGKQVIHPNHIRLLRYGFSPGNEDLHRSLRILEEAIRANAFLGGAIRFEDEMMDPPMFAKALQLLMRSAMLGNQDTGVMEVVSGLIASLPAEKFIEIWPYPGWPPFAAQ